MLISDPLSGQEISLPFLNLPPRQLADYYKLIKHPVSLKSAQKKVRGIRGRDKPTNVSFLRNWQAFEDEVSFIWHNAREYNEDGSDISRLAGQIEVSLPSCSKVAVSHTNLRRSSRNVWQRQRRRFQSRSRKSSSRCQRRNLRSQHNQRLCCASVVRSPAQH